MQTSKVDQGVRCEVFERRQDASQHLDIIFIFVRDRHFCRYIDNSTCHISNSGEVLLYEYLEHEVFSSSFTNWPLQEI